MRSRKSTKEIRALLKEQVNSGLSQIEFCKQYKISVSTFSNYKKRAAKEGIKFRELRPENFCKAASYKIIWHDFEIQLSALPEVITFCKEMVRDDRI